MDDSQLQYMTEMVKNKEMMKQMYRAQGMEMSDEQLDSMASMMNPQFIKQATDMLSTNPDIANSFLNMQQPQNASVASTSQSQNS